MSAWLAPLLLACVLQGPEIPRNDGWVSDQAGLLSDTEERSLESLMESYRSGTGHEIALLTVTSLGGRPIEELARRTARAWGLGGKDANDGALLVVARDDRELRIEVGRGLEGNLTDAISGRIIRDVITPEFKRERYYAGIRAGIEAIHAAIGGDYGPIEKGGKGGDAAGLFCVIAVVLAVIVLKSRGTRSGGLGGLGSALPWILLSSMRGGRSSGWGGGGFRGGGGGFSGFGGGGGFSGGGASGRW